MESARYSLKWTAFIQRTINSCGATEETAWGPLTIAFWKRQQTLTELQYTEAKRDFTREIRQGKLSNTISLYSEITVAETNTLSPNTNESAFDELHVYSIIQNAKKTTFNKPVSQ